MSKKLTGITLGEILLEEYLKPTGISQADYARAIGLPASRISEIIKGRRAISTDYALRFARFWGTSPELWLNMQAKCDLENAKETAKAIKREVPTMRQYLRRAKALA